MMNIRPIRLAAFILATSALGVVNAGCKETHDEPAPADPAAARAPTNVDEPTPKEEPEEQDEQKTDELPSDQNDDLELAWFKGVDHLPKAHPCQDSTAVIHAKLSLGDEADQVGDPFEYEVSTLGELRESLGPDWVHFGPRTVRGVRWESDGEDFLVVTCNMGGVGFRSFSDQTSLETEGVDMDEARDAKFIIGQVGEASSVEWGSLYSMRRSGPDEPWETLGETTAWSNDDESNDPQYVARARIIAAEDSDGDDAPEVVSVMIQDRNSWEDKGMREDICPEQDPSHYCNGFELDVRAREGDQVAADRVILRLDGEHALTEKAEKPQDMSDAAFATLRTRLEAHREGAVSKARAILREDEKLR